MRIVHVVRSDAYAGVESHIARLARAQMSRGDDVVVVGGDPERMRAAVGPGATVVPARTVVEVVRATRTSARTADVVHAHMTAGEVGAALALVGSETRLVVTRHFARTRGSNPLSVLAGAWAARRFGAQIAISDWVARSVAGPCRVIHPGVDHVDSAPAAGLRDPVVLVAQRLEAEKETDVALRAFAEAGLATDGWLLMVAGDGARRAELEVLAGELGIAHATRFLGHRSDVVDLMKRAAVLLAPCRVEGLGLTVLEAMAAALPVVAVGAGGHLETVGSVEGAALHDPGDAHAAAVLLRDLALDPSRRDVYADALQRTQRERFTPEHQAAQTAEVYEELT